MPDFSLQNRLKSFLHALRGAVTLIGTQHNARVHAVATVVVLVAGLWLKVSLIEWALLITAIALVWIAEALNTALEFLADEITRERRDRIKKAKDVAAFGVLVSALAAATLGVIVFLPYFVQLTKISSWTLTRAAVFRAVAANTPRSSKPAPSLCPPPNPRAHPSDNALPSPRD